jgi:predicted MPP superfamily phosphohydrolase
MNDAIRIKAHGHDFWLSGTESVLTGPDLGYPQGPGIWGGRDDLAGTLAKTDDSVPIIHMAHEPDMFASMPQHVALTLSGHTHGGQVNLPLIGRPMVHSRTGMNLAYGHIVQDDRHIVISGGLGCSHLPIRLGVPPEIVLVNVASA